MAERQRPDTPTMLDQLEAAYQRIEARLKPVADDRARLESIVADLRWYASRLGISRWEQPPRPDRWSFAENLWHVAEQAIADADLEQPLSITYYIDHGKEHVGQAAEIYALFEY
jgi:hypothetical protein